MIRRIRTNVAWLLLFSILLVNLPFLSPGAAAQKLLPVNQHGSAVKLAAKFMAGGIGLPDNLLERCGFKPAIEATAWAHYPPAMKIEAAYHAAERASRGGGEAWLAMLAQELARRYEAAANDPFLRRLLSGGAAQGCPSFAAPQVNYRSKLSQRHRAVINRLAAYCGGAATGYIANTVARYFDIPFDVASRIFTSNRYDLEAGLNKALERVPRNLRDSKARALVEHIASLNEGVRRDPLMRELTQAAVYVPESKPSDQTPRNTAPRIVAQEVLPVDVLELTVDESATSSQPPAASNLDRKHKWKRRVNPPAEESLPSFEVFDATRLRGSKAAMRSVQSEPVRSYAESATPAPSTATIPYSFDTGIRVPSLDASRDPRNDNYRVGGYKPSAPKPRGTLGAPRSTTPSEPSRAGAARTGSDITGQRSPRAGGASPDVLEIVRKHQAAQSPQPVRQTPAPVTRPAPNTPPTYVFRIEKRSPQFPSVRPVGGRATAAPRGVLNAPRGGTLPPCP